MTRFPPAPAMRPRKGGLAGWLDAHKFALLTGAMTLLRGIVPVLKLGNHVIVTRYDDVRAVLGEDAKFLVGYKDALEVATGEPLFVLGENDPARLAANLALLWEVIRREDYAHLAAAAMAEGEALLAAAPGRIELVDGYLRALSFGLFESYLGIPPGGEATLRFDATRLFEFVFYQGDAELRAAAPGLAKAIAELVDAGLAHPPAEGVLARCRALIDAGDPRISPEWVRSMLGGMLIGGPPQPVIVLAQAIDELLKRPEALAGAEAAARGGDDDLLYGHILEAMRFRPLGPALLRTAGEGAVVARGTWHEKALSPGTQVIAGVVSAMTDPRRIADPARFDPRRPRNSYLHYGFGAHECFARQLNAVLLPAMLKPLLRRKHLRRAPGKAGTMQVNGPFPETFWLEFD